MQLGDMRSDDSLPPAALLAESTESKGVFEQEATEIGPRRDTPRVLPASCCRELPSSLGPDQVGQLVLVTHLSAREIKTVDHLFCLLVELSLAIGEHVPSRVIPGSDQGTPRAASAKLAPGPSADSHWALTARQLRRLPEFSQNVFLERFIRVVSETGEDNVTLLELLDLYSALSHRASLEWKAWFLFCVFDYDEDGMLDSGDIYRTIRQMIVNTHSMRFSGGRRTDAAILIQAHLRGRQHRKEAAIARAKMGEPPIRALGRSPTFTEAYTRKILNKCQSVQHMVMDFRYFETVLRKSPSFQGCFRVTMCKPRRIEKLLRGSNLEKVAEHEMEHFQRIKQYLSEDDTGAAHLDGQAESTVNPLHQSKPSLGSWDRNDALARRVKHLDRAIEKRTHELDVKLDADDYDVSRQDGDGLWKPYGDMGTENAYGMRPPVLATRLRWIGLDMRMLRMLSGKGGAQAHMTTHKSDRSDYEADSVEQILHEFSGGRKGSFVGYLVKSMVRRVERLHHGLWGHALADISHKHGAGIMELASIMKWMLLLNFALGMMWMLLVVVPRDFDADNSVQASFLTVMSAMVVNGSDTQRNLFYDGFERKQGILVHMDFFYFTAIIATIVISLAAMLWKLGTIPIGGTKTKKVEADAGMEWATILAAYDFTQVDLDSASKMRQSIRGRIEDWHADLKEALLIEQIEQASWVAHLKIHLRLKVGTFMTNLLLVGYAVVWFWMLNNEKELTKYHVLLAPAILASLNASSPPIIKAITIFEHRAKSIDVMEVCVQRIFRVKIVQLLTIYYTIFKIMSSTHVQQVREDFGQSTFSNSTEERFTGEGILDSWIGNSTDYDECPEARSGAIFLHQLVMDAVVFITIQYSYLFMVTVGFPNLFTWRSAVRSFGKGTMTEKDGYQLQSRLVNVAVHETLNYSALKSAISKKSSLRQTRKKLRWFMLAPHKEGRWYKQSVISILLESFIHQVTRQGADTEEAKHQVLVDSLPRWREKVAQHHLHAKDEMLKSDYRTVAHKISAMGLLDDGADSRPPSRQLKTEHVEVQERRHNLARAIVNKSAVFSTMDLDALSEQRLADAGSRTDVEEETISDFRAAAHRFKEQAAHALHDLPDDDPDSARHNVSGLETTNDEFVERIEDAMRKLARHVCELEQTGDEAMAHLLAARPTHRERGRCNCGHSPTGHKTSKATEIRHEKREGETPAQNKTRKNVTILLKSDVQYAASAETQSPLHELRSLLSAVPASQLCLLVESCSGSDEGEDKDGILVDSVSIDQAQAWRYHRFYLNQSIASWLEGITIPLLATVLVDGKKKKRRVYQNLSHKTQKALVDALANRDIYTIGEMIDSQLDDHDLQMLIKGENGEKFPKSIVRRLREAQGDWTDVTAAVDQKRWIRMPPTELKHDESASLIIGMLWRQVFVWAGTAFCPWLPLMACALQILMFTALQHCLLHGRYLPPKQTWAVGATTQLFMRFGMQTLLLCVLPITMWLNGKPGCGPHAGIQIASTYTLFEEEVLVPAVTEQYSENIRVLLKSLSFVVHYMVNSTFLLLIVFVLWTRGRTRQIQLTSAKSRVKQLKTQMRLDSAYLQSRLRDAKTQADKATQKASIYLEQQKMHQYIMSTLGVQLKAKSGPGSAKHRQDKIAEARSKDSFLSITTRIWPLSEQHGLAQRHRRHIPIIWLIQDTSVPNFTQFTVRVNDEVVVPPSLQRNDLCGEVSGEDHVLELEFDLPEDMMADTSQNSKVKLTITAPDANCFQKIGHTLPSHHPVPNYQYNCVLMHDGTQSIMQELQDREPNLDTPINGISYGQVAVDQERWVVRMPIYREVAQAADKSGNSVTDQHVTEFQVELLKCTVESKDEPLDEDFCAANLEKLTHKELLKQATAAGIDAQTVASHKNRTGSYQTNALIEEIVRAEVERPKKKVPTVIAKYRLGVVWHRHSHFINLYNSLATCLSKKEQKTLPPGPVQYHDHMHLFGNHHGHLLEEQRKNLETFMQDLLNHGSLQPHLNPYFLGFLGMFVESTEDEEANNPYIVKTRWKLRHSAHEAAVLSHLHPTERAEQFNGGLDTIREVDRTTPPDIQPEPEQEPEQEEERAQDTV